MSHFRRFWVEQSCCCSIGYISEFAKLWSFHSSFIEKLIYIVPDMARIVIRHLLQGINSQTVICKKAGAFVWTAVIQIAEKVIGFVFHSNVSPFRLQIVLEFTDNVIPHPSERPGHCCCLIVFSTVHTHRTPSLMSSVCQQSFLTFEIKGGDLKSSLK